MNKKMFINDLEMLLSRYNMDKIIGFNLHKLAVSIYWILYTFYDFPKKEVK